MYGFAGYVGLAPDGTEVVLRRMARQLTFRPDEGRAIVRQGGTGLVHHDQDAIGMGSGEQLARSPDGRWLLVCDGVIHNLDQLREALADQGCIPVTGAQPDVLLAAWLEWGDGAFDRVNGGFTVAIVDTGTGAVVLARDPLGLHPLYLTADGSGRVAFASEIHPVLAAAVVPRRPDDVTIYRYLRFGVHDDTERTFFRNVTRVLPGQLVRIAPDGTVTRQTYTRLRYELEWLAARPRPYDAPARDEIVFQLAAAVRRRLPGDVPLGVVESGGDPSSTVRDLVEQVLVRADREAGTPARHRAVHDVTRRPDRPLDELIDFVRAQEEPAASVQAFVHYTVVRQAARHVPVILDGLGAEELLAGLPSHQVIRLRQLLRQRRLWEAAIESVCARQVLRRAARWPRWSRRSGPACLLAPDFAAAHADQRPEPVPTDLKRRLADDLFRDRLPARLRYHHRNALRFGVEIRTPLLDPALLRVLWGLTDEALLHRGQNLRVLRDAAADLALETGARVGRRGSGRAPVDRSLARLLHRDEASFAELLVAERLRSGHYVDPAAVTAAFRGYLAGKAVVAESPLWRVINLELWLREFIEGDPTVSRELAAGSAGSPSQHLAPDQVEHVVDLADPQQHGQAHVGAAHHEPTGDELEPRLAGGERA